MRWPLSRRTGQHPIRQPPSARAAARGEASAAVGLVILAYSYEAVRDANTRSVKRMSRLSGLLSLTMVIQMVLWAGGLAL